MGPSIISIDYYGRATDVIVLAEDHFFVWLNEVEIMPDPGCRVGSAGYKVTVDYDQTDTFGGMHLHRVNGTICGGYVSWRSLGTMKASGHQLISVDPLHIEASLACRSCGSHGFIRNGMWEAC